MYGPVASTVPERSDTVSGWWNAISFEPGNRPSVRRRGRARDLSRRASLGSRRARRCAGTQRASSASDPGPRSRSSQRRFLGHCRGRSSCFAARPSRRRVPIEVNFVLIRGEISSDESADRRFPRAALSTANHAEVDRAQEVVASVLRAQSFRAWPVRKQRANNRLGMLAGSNQRRASGGVVWRKRRYAFRTFRVRRFRMERALWFGSRSQTRVKVFVSSM